MVWEGYSGGGDCEVFLYDPPFTTQLTNNSYGDYDPRINDDGFVTWEGWVGGADSEIFVYNGVTATQLTNNFYGDWDPQINSDGHVAWHGQEGGADSEIYLYNGTSTTVITNNSYNDYYAQISDNGDVVWEGYEGSADPEIFHYDGSSATQITDNTSSDRYPQINASGNVVWYGSEGGDFEIFLGLDEATLIELISFCAVPQGPGIHVTWETASEIDSEGFHLWRAGSGEIEFTRITATVIPSEGRPFGGAKYEYIDDDVRVGRTYHYKLEEINIYGISTFHGPASATVGTLCGAIRGTTGNCGILWSSAMGVLMAFVWLLRKRVG